MTDSVSGGGGGANPAGRAGLVAVVLAAGAGRRLRPLTLRRPKPLCPVGNVALLDAALERAGSVSAHLAVNVHHGRDQIERHLEGRPDVHLSVESEEPLGTAGALGRLRSWIDGRPVLAVNADTWSTASLADAVEGWDGERPRVMVAGEPRFGPRAGIVATLLPWSVVAGLTEQPASLYETTWRPAAAAGHLDVVGSEAVFFDCGTPRSYLAANLTAAAAAGGSIVGEGSIVEGDVEGSVVGHGCRVAGRVTASVLWDGAEVREGERLDRAIRANETMTVLVR